MEAAETIVLPAHQIIPKSRFTDQSKPITWIRKKKRLDKQRLSYSCLPFRFSKLNQF